ncbi:LacI family DNA-binding transcriptional regulator [Microbacterium sp. ASV49]|uniref:LacI family DNA-binding transcriptional regulator n=1 Tax=Microbacterium candidum TaxID=3041922 RepID=A0ABT7MWJ3_9MICO|nr:LacI family DNA-binding transcriptional regulator [Microbacterium sp. ASV49]MDL9978809.1 LacI family DNA-binding transcriptional regulator [Microbacterium sp. ASV49]
MSARPDPRVRIGIADVAREAGVSITTVSHAFSGRGHVSERTRAHVHDVAARLGYSPNRIASALRSRRSNIVGFVSDDIATTPYAGRVVLGAQDAAAAHDQLLVLVNSNNDVTVESKQIAALVAQQVDAVVYARMFHRETTVPPALDGVPTVLVDTVDPTGMHASVVPDEQQIARLATEVLYEAGHRSIVHVTVDAQGPAVNGRIEGYRSAMAKYGLQPVVVEGGDPGIAATGRTAFQRLCSVSAELPTAIFCFNDQMAMGVYQAAQAVGLRIPADISVVGVDDFEPVSAELLPGLTTVGLPHYEMGRWAVEATLANLSEDSAAHVSGITRMPGVLVTRESVAPPRR